MGILNVVPKVTLTLILIAAISCTAPKRENYTCAECFTAIDCLYRIKDDKDKSVCAPLVEVCRDRLRSDAMISRYEYCRKYVKECDRSKEECMTFRECLK